MNPSIISQSRACRRFNPPVLGPGCLQLMIFCHENGWAQQPCRLSPQPCHNAYGNREAFVSVQSCDICNNPCLPSCESHADPHANRTRSTPADRMVVSFAFPADITVPQSTVSAFSPCVMSRSEFITDSTNDAGQPPPQSSFPEAQTDPSTIRRTLPS